MTINKLDTLGRWMVRRYVKPYTNEVWKDAVTTAYPTGYRPLYVPSTPCKIEHSNIVGPSSGRDETGHMHVDWVITDSAKVYLHYNAITGAELAYIQNLLQGQEFSLKYFDDNTIHTINAYASESSYQHYSYALGDIIYQDYEIHLIEL